MEKSKLGSFLKTASAVTEEDPMEKQAEDAMLTGFLMGEGFLAALDKEAVSLKGIGTAIKGLPGKIKGLPGKTRGLPGKAKKLPGKADLKAQDLGQRVITRGKKILRRKNSTRFSKARNKRIAGYGTLAAGAGAAGAGAAGVSGAIKKKNEKTASVKTAADLILRYDS